MHRVPQPPQLHSRFGAESSRDRITPQGSRCPNRSTTPTLHCNELCASACRPPLWRPEITRDDVRGVIVPWAPPRASRPDKCLPAPPAPFLCPPRAHTGQATRPARQRPHRHPAQRSPSNRRLPPQRKKTQSPSQNWPHTEIKKHTPRHFAKTPQHTGHTAAPR